MAYSKYYTDYQAPQSQRQDMSALMQKLRELQLQSQQQQQQNMSADNMQGIGNLGKSIFGSGSPSSFGGQSGGVGGSYLSGDAGLGMDLGGTAGQGTSWYSSLFNSPSSALMNPAVAIPAAALFGANVAHNKGISSWGDTLKGQLGGNTIDYYAEGNHGIGSKIFDKDNPLSAYEGSKALTDLATLDFKNAFKHGGNALMNPFKALKKLF